MDPNKNVDVNFIKGIMCSLITSDKVESAVHKCAERVEYNGARIDENTFEDEKGREDYFPLMREVAMINISPFTKSLFAELSGLTGLINQIDSQRSKS